MNLPVFFFPTRIRQKIPGSLLHFCNAFWLSMELSVSSQASNVNEKITPKSPFVYHTSGRRSAALASSCTLSTFCADNEPDDSPNATASRICINICGERYDVPADMFMKHPTTLLGDPEKVARYFDPARQEYYFNRNRACSEAILAYYQSGMLHRPNNIPLKSFIMESRFFQLDKQALLQICNAEGFQPTRAVELPKNKYQRRLWLLVDDPHSSIAARVFSVFSLLVIVLSVIVLCMSTMPQYLHTGSNVTEIAAENQGNHSENLVEAELLAGCEQFQNPLFIVTTACIVWFTVEFLLRLISCPDKKRFFKSGINIIDLIAIVPYYIDVGVTVVGLTSGTSSTTKAGIMGLLRMLRIIRIFRVVRLSRYSKGLQILGETFLVSIRELGLLLLFLGIMVILFSCSIYYAELGVEKSQFESIPDAFWWAIVTMTTVGYGDIAPKGLFGKLVGACCAISGLMAIALPVPVIVSNFNTLYLREKQRPEVEELLGDVLRSPAAEDTQFPSAPAELTAQQESERRSTVMSAVKRCFDEMLRKN